MGKISLSLVVLGIISLSTANVCIPIDHCECSEETREIHCVNIDLADWDIKGAFQASAHLLDPNTVFERLWLFGTQKLATIPAGTFHGYRFKEIEMTVNWELATISEDAFNATFSDTTALILGANEFKDLDILNLVNRFQNLVTLRLYSNEFTTIPDRAFSSHPHLEWLDLSNNPLTTIGSHPFIGMPKLQKLDLFRKETPYIQRIEQDTFQGLNNNTRLEINLMGIGLSQERIEPVLEVVKSLVTGFKECIFSNCYYYPIYNCTLDNHWVCDRVNEFGTKLKGYHCYSDGEDIFVRCGH